MAKQTGVQRAASNMVVALLRYDPFNEYLVFTGEQRHPELEDYPNVKLVHSRLDNSNVFGSLIWEQFVLPRLAKKYAVDLLHCPANMAPYFYGGRSVIHIHDMCFLVNPEWYSFLFRTWYKLLIPLLAKKADRIITNSNNSRNDLISFCKLPLSKVSLVYWAVDEAFYSDSLAGKKANLPEDDYILYVGSLEPRKNIARTLEAFQKFRDENPEFKTKLVLIGGESPVFSAVKMQIRSRYLNDLIFKGYVSEHELRYYYRGARLLVYPSLYEGFGLPPLEAMASGTPVMTSNTSSLPEVVGDAAAKVDPNNVAAISQGIAAILSQESVRAELVARGYRQVRKFDWGRVARQIVNNYHEVCYSQPLSERQWSQLVARASRHTHCPGSHSLESSV